MQERYARVIRRHSGIKLAACAENTNAQLNEYALVSDSDSV
jgi:hypothetical protein